MKSSLKILLALVVALFLMALIAVGYYFVTLPKPVVLQGQVEMKVTHIASKISGRIGTIKVSEGDSIKKGDLLLSFDSPEVEAKVKQAKAVEKAASALVEKAQNGARSFEKEMAFQQKERAKEGFIFYQKSYNRIESLYKKQLISTQKRDEVYAKYMNAKKQYQTAEAHYKMALEGARAEDKKAALAKHQQAQGVLNEAMVAEDEMNLKSPVAGEVSQIIPNDGEIVSKGMTLVTVTDLNNIRVEINVREDYLKHFLKGSKVKGFIPALDKKFEFEVYAFSVLPNFATWRPTRSDEGFDMKTFLVKLKPLQGIKDIRAGMSVLVTLD